MTVASGTSRVSPGTRHDARLRLAELLSRDDLSFEVVARRSAATGALHSYRLELAWKDPGRAWFRGAGVLGLFSKAGLAPDLLDRLFDSMGGAPSAVPLAVELDAPGIRRALPQLERLGAGTTIITTAASIERSGGDGIRDIRAAVTAGLAVAVEGLPLAEVTVSLIRSLCLSEIVLPTARLPHNNQLIRGLIVAARATGCLTSMTVDHNWASGRVEFVMPSGVDLIEHANERRSVITSLGSD